MCAASVSLACIEGWLEIPKGMLIKVLTAMVVSVFLFLQPHRLTDINWLFLFDF